MMPEVNLPPPHTCAHTNEQYIHKEGGEEQVKHVGNYVVTN